MGSREGPTYTKWYISINYVLLHIQGWVHEIKRMGTNVPQHYNSLCYMHACMPIQFYIIIIVSSPDPSGLHACGGKVR